MHVARADDEDVAEFDLGALRSGNGFEVFDRNASGVESIVRTTLFNAPFMIIKQDSSPANPALRSYSPNTKEIGLLDSIRAMDIIERQPIIELGLLLVSEVAQAIPLRRRLGVEGPDVVVDDARRLLVDFFVELLAAEEGQVALRVERPVDVDAYACGDFVGGCFDDRVA